MWNNIRSVILGIMKTFTSRNWGEKHENIKVEGLRDEIWTKYLFITKQKTC
jgi:hypothetical protein